MSPLYIYLEWFASGVILSVFGVLFVEKKLLIDWLLILRSNGTFYLRKFVRFPKNPEWTDSNKIIRKIREGPFYRKGGTQLVYFHNDKITPEGIDKVNDWSSAGRAVSQAQRGKAYKDLIGAGDLPVAFILVAAMIVIMAGLIGYLAHGGV